MKTNILITIALTLFLFTSCSYKTNMWHYDEAQARIQVKHAIKKNTAPAMEAPVEEQPYASTGIKMEEHTNTVINSELDKEIIASEEKSHTSVKTNTSNCRISGHHVSNKLMKNKKIHGKRSAPVDTGDFITDLLTTIILGLILFGLAIGLFIGLIAALFAGAGWAAWVLGGLVVLTLVGIATA